MPPGFIDDNEGERVCYSLFQKVKPFPLDSTSAILQRCIFTHTSLCSISLHGLCKSKLTHSFRSCIRSDLHLASIQNPGSHF